MSRGRKKFPEFTENKRTFQVRTEVFWKYKLFKETNSKQESYIGIISLVSIFPVL